MTKAKLSRTAYLRMVTARLAEGRKKRRQKTTAESEATNASSVPSASVDTEATSTAAKPASRMTLRSKRDVSFPAGGIFLSFPPSKMILRQRDITEREKQLIRNVHGYMNRWTRALPRGVFTSGPQRITEALFGISSATLKECIEVPEKKKKLQLTVRKDSADTVKDLGLGTSKHGKGKEVAERILKNKVREVDARTSETRMRVQSEVTNPESSRCANFEVDEVVLKNYFDERSGASHSTKRKSVESSDKPSETSHPGGRSIKDELGEVTLQDLHDDGGNCSTSTGNGIRITVDVKKENDDGLGGAVDNSCPGDQPVTLPKSVSDDSPMMTDDDYRRYISSLPMLTSEDSLTMGDDDCLSDFDGSTDSTGEENLLYEDEETVKMMELDEHFDVGERGREDSLELDEEEHFLDDDNESAKDDESVDDEVADVKPEIGGSEQFAEEDSEADGEPLEDWSLSVAMAAASGRFVSSDRAGVRPVTPPPVKPVFHFAPALEAVQRDLAPYGVIGTLLKSFVKQVSVNGKPRTRMNVAVKEQLVKFAIMIEDFCVAEKVGVVLKTHLFDVLAELMGITRRVLSELMSSARLAKAPLLSPRTAFGVTDDLSKVSKLPKRKYDSTWCRIKERVLARDGNLSSLRRRAIILPGASGSVLAQDGRDSVHNRATSSRCISSGTTAQSTSQSTPSPSSSSSLCQRRKIWPCASSRVHVGRLLEPHERKWTLNKSAEDKHATVKKVRVLRFVKPQSVDKSAVDKNATVVKDNVKNLKGFQVVRPGAALSLNEMLLSATEPRC